MYFFFDTIQRCLDIANEYENSKAIYKRLRALRIRFFIVFISEQVLDAKGKLEYSFEKYDYINKLFRIYQVKLYLNQPCMNEAHAIFLWLNRYENLVFEALNLLSEEAKTALYDTLVDLKQYDGTFATEVGEIL